jgi:AAA domain, putative AbiEii toxin, Type IV TA system
LSVLVRLSAIDTGPFRALQLDLGPRLNLLTGDNGLGKSFLLDLVWYASTWTWAGLSALPHPARSVDPAGGPGAGRYFTTALTAVFEGGRAYTNAFHVPSLSWTPRNGAASGDPGDGAVVYARVDGGFCVWDAYRNRGREAGTAPDERPASFVMTREQVWEGLPDGPRWHCNGLLRDWISWQQTRNGAFQALEGALAALSGEGAEALRVGAPQRVGDDARDIPTLALPYGEVPITHASAGMRRICALAYVLVWAWREHRLAAERRASPPLDRMILLVDEAEAHLHPRWQRRVVPALLEAVRALAPEVQVQIVVATHSPLVMASVEVAFDPSVDRLFQFDLDGSELVVEERPFAKQGDAAAWLVSDTFGLQQARSVPAQAAIEAAESMMRGELAGPPAAVAEVDRRLREALPELDHFWPRWLGWASRQQPSP